MGIPPVECYLFLEVELLVFDELEKPLFLSLKIDPQKVCNLLLDVLRPCSFLSRTEDIDLGLQTVGVDFQEAQIVASFEEQIIGNVQNWFFENVLLQKENRRSVFGESNKRRSLKPRAFLEEILATLELGNDDSISESEEVHEVVQESEVDSSTTLSLNLREHFL